MAKQHDGPRKALGKGLSALLPQRATHQATAPVPAPVPQPAPEPTDSGLATVSVDAIEPNPLQPRTTFEADRLNELAQSILAHGIIQPLIVQKRNGRYQLVAGERRWRAAKLAGLTEVPVVVQNLADDRLLEVSLIENIQREDLNPIEVAHAFDRLGRELGLSHEQIGQRTGKERATISNMLRLLRLPHEVQLLVAEHRLSMGHARAILGLHDQAQQIQLAQKTVNQGLSVRQVERLVQQIMAPPPPEDPQPPPVIDPNVKAAIQQLEQTLGTRVRIVERNPQKGRIEIEYYSQDDLVRLYALIVKTETGDH